LKRKQSLTSKVLLLARVKESLTCIIHEDIQKSSKPLLEKESGDWTKKQSVF
jgi:hypothetical protein